MIKNNSKLIDNWTLRFDEVSNNVYQVDLIDKFGRQAGTKDHDLYRAIETCISFAFDIEKELGNNLNKFTYDCFKYFLNDQKLTVDHFSDEDFGSWTIQKAKNRIILDGRDLLLSLQVLTDQKNWTDKFNFKIKEMTFEQLLELKDRLIIND